VQKRIGPAWTQRGRPAEGHFTKRTAEASLHSMLGQAEAGTLPGMTRSNATVADACAEWLRYVRNERAIKHSTSVEYDSVVRTHLLPTFGDVAIEDVTVEMIERWRAGMTCSPRTKNKALTVLHGVLRRAQRVWRLPTNPAAEVERVRERQRVDIDVFSGEEVWALVRAADSEQDAAIYLTAAFTGLRRGELIALRWRDVDFTGSLIRVRASYSFGVLSSPKSGRVPVVPMAPDVADALARVGGRDRWTTDDDLVFSGQLGLHLDGRALTRRYYKALDRAGLRRLRFHDLRHTFGTRTIMVADILRVKEWMGHSSVSTTMRYLHYTPRPDDAELIARAFAPPAEMPERRAGRVSGEASPGRPEFRFR
jgi:integrase